MTSGHILNLLLIDSEYTLLLQPYFFLLYLHNILCTKNFCFHIYTLNLLTFQILLMSFSLLILPLHMVRCISVVSLKAYVYGLYNTLLLLFPLPFFHIFLLIFFLYLPLIFHILPVFCILVQMQSCSESHTGAVFFSM